MCTALSPGVCTEQSRQIQGPTWPRLQRAQPCCPLHTPLDCVITKQRGGSGPSLQHNAPRRADAFTAQPPPGKKGKDGAVVEEKPKLNPLYEECMRWVVPAHGQVELVALFQVRACLRVLSAGWSVRCCAGADAGGGRVRFFSWRLCASSCRRWISCCPVCHGLPAVVACADQRLWAHAAWVGRLCAWTGGARPCHTPSQPSPWQLSVGLVPSGACCHLHSTSRIRTPT